MSKIYRNGIRYNSMTVGAASDTKFSSGSSGLSADNVQTALEELDNTMRNNYMLHKRGIARSNRTFWETKQWYKIASTTIMDANINHDLFFFLSHSIDGMADGSAIIKATILADETGYKYKYAQISCEYNSGSINIKDMVMIVTQNKEANILTAEIWLTIKNENEAYRYTVLQEVEVGRFANVWTIYDLPANEETYGTGDISKINANDMGVLRHYDDSSSNHLNQYTPIAVWSFTEAGSSTYCGLRIINTCNGQGNYIVDINMTTGSSNNTLDTATINVDAKSGNSSDVFLIKNNDNTVTLWVKGITTGLSPFDIYHLYGHNPSMLDTAKWQTTEPTGTKILSNN